MGYEFRIGEKEYSVDVKGQGERLQVDLGKGYVDVDVCRIGDHSLSLCLGNRSYRVNVASDGVKCYVHVGGGHFCVEEVAQAPSGGYARETGGAAELSVCAPMPGTIVSVLVRKGDQVEKNQGLVIVESMKMENTLRARMRGRVAKVHFKDGDLVDAGVPVVELVPTEGGS